MSKAESVIPRVVPPLLVFVCICLVYLLTMPGTVVLEDDGLFILAAYYNGVAHPPGYPLYTLLAHVATWFPFGSIAGRVHGFSAVLGALGCVCLYQIILRLKLERCYAVVGALCLGYSLTFWSQSIIAEVYSLNVLIFLVLVWLTLTYVDSDNAHRQGVLNGMGLVYGLGLSNHWPLLGLSTPVLLVLLWPHRRELLGHLPRGLLFGLLGLLPYGWMVWRSQMDPLISFYGPISSWQEFWFYVSREGYAEMDVSPSAGWGDKLGFGLYVLTETARQFSWLGTGLVVVGFVRQWRNWRRPVSVALTLGYLGNTFILIGLLGFDDDFLHRNIFRVYPLVAYGICAIWLSLGLKVVVDWIMRRWRTGLRRGLLQAVTGALVVGATLMVNTADNYRANDSWAEDYARVILESLDDNAVLFTAGDLIIGPVGYLNMVNGLRPDVTLYQDRGLVLSNRLVNPYHLDPPGWETSLNAFINQTYLPVYYINDLPLDFGSRYSGIYLKLDRGLAKGEQVFVLEESLVNYFYRIIRAGKPSEPWELMHYRWLVADFCGLLQMYSMINDISKFSEEILNSRCTTLQSLTKRAEALLSAEDPDLGFIAQLLGIAEGLYQQANIKADISKVYYLAGEINTLRGEDDKAIENYTQAYLIWPSRENPAFDYIEQGEG